MTEPLDVASFSAAFLRFLETVNEHGHPGHRDELADLLGGHLGGPVARTSVVGTRLPLFEHVNVQVALDAWRSEGGRSVEVHGVAAMHMRVGLRHLLGSAQHRPPVELGAPDFVDLPSGPGRTLPCLRSALLLVTDARGAYLVFVGADDENGPPRLALEVAGLPTGQAQEVLAEVEQLRDRLNVYRGQVVELRHGGLAFPDLPRTARDDVVLPEDVLRRLERHSLDVSAQRDRLRAAGVHLKRGLLLYGPPGTGKTHTVRYLVQHLPGTTVVMLSGQALHELTAATQLARSLQPAAVVLEDVDLVAEDRGYGPGPSPVLFELLDAMDGAAADADLLFLLTTNRADLLEPALAARPGRVDVAVEIGLPDAAARDRLLSVHAAGLELRLSTDERAGAVERMAGVTASFVKELLRRAALEALSAGADGSPLLVETEHVTAALDDLLDSGQRVTRALLGVPDGTSGVAREPSGPEWAPSPSAWFGRGVRHGHGAMPAVYLDDDV